MLRMLDHRKQRGLKMEKKFSNISIDNITFRQATLNDIEEILQFDILEETTLFTRTKLEDEISSNVNYCIVAIYGNVVIAYSSMSIMYDHADLLYISVSKDFKRIGIAKKLIDILVDRCKELKLEGMFLEVRESNISAISLYIKCGFTKISERKNYYSLPDETALILKRKI